MRTKLARLEDIDRNIRRVISILEGIENLFDTPTADEDAMFKAASVHIFEASENLERATRIK